MRMHAIFLAGALVLAMPLWSATTTVTAAQPNSSVGPVEQDSASRLDSLFAALKSAADPDAAESTENEIFAIWLESGSDTVDLLMRWTLNAMEAKDYALALDYLDRIVTMQPDYAEGWHKRATVHFLVDDYSKAIADIERTLAVEPRHFAALSGLGRIMQDIGASERALFAYRRALSIDPHLEDVVEALSEIEAEEAGQEL